MEATEIKTVLFVQRAAKFFDYPQLAGLSYEDSQMMRNYDSNRYLQGSHGSLGGTTYHAKAFPVSFGK